jgi:hypothetical protein
MKIALKAFGAWIAFLIILYAAFAFAKWSTNPGTWGEERNLFSAFAFVMLVPIVGLALAKAEEQKESPQKEP